MLAAILMDNCWTKWFGTEARGSGSSVTSWSQSMTNPILTAALALAVLTPPLSAQGQTSGNGKTAASKDIVTVATEAGSFTTLVTALKAAGLVETLKGPGPFTVFAPNDAAFAKLPKGTVEGLLADKNALSSVLTFHVISGRVMAGDIVKSKGAKPKTVNGQELDIQLRDGKVFVNGAQVITTDIAASNGVIHVIDGVLLPKSSAPASGR
jgi:uncharacterized surface protein with fasciclin (FAS1) repeats